MDRAATCTKGRQSDATEDEPVAGGAGGGPVTGLKGVEFCGEWRGAWRGVARRAHAANLCSFGYSNALYPTSHGRN
ncbi:hypothetical protein NDU88_001123 [Pleurodeles waltl]|uniref:Uncharacterized protein n=1 Tax=Pleurodeles waltl TaxID=8319 RepID=A0AAV7LC77_PLEWA|nr:hypothetical protein NDU88_001123 [Pleurodeles waltl]